MLGHNNNIYDVIIIGSGISGLVCGCYIAKAGMKVLIVEQHDKPGGYCTSFKRQGFTFDAAAHSLGSYREGGNLRRIISELGIDKLIKIIRFNPSDIIITPRFNLTFWNDTKDTIDDLISVFPSEKDNIANFFSYFNKLNDNSTPTSLFESVKFKGKTFHSFLRTFFTDNALINAISCVVFGYVGLPPSLMQAATGIKIFNEYVIDAGYYPEGGMQELSNAFASIIMRNGGTFLYRESVKKILTKNNMVVGVKLSNDESYESRYVVSASDVSQTFKDFLDKKIVEQKLLDKLVKFIPSVSTFILYLGLARSFDGLTKPGTNMWFLPSYDLDEVFNCITSGDFKNFGGGYVFRVSPDGKTMLVFCLTSFKTKLFWEQNKRKIAEDLLSRIEILIPNLKKNIDYFDAATPYTLYRYTHNYKGANYGWAPLQSQSFDHDFRQKSNIQGLYLTGHWTTQTHGIPSVAALGHNAAKLILKHERNHPR
jgi:phytoene dehydrogenase-like protein